MAIEILTPEAEMRAAWGRMYDASRTRDSGLYMDSDAIVESVGGDFGAMGLLPFSVHRDSDTVSESNHMVMLQELERAEPEGKAWAVHRFRCAFYGWQDHIFVNLSDDSVREVCVSAVQRVRDYPILNDMHHSEHEWESAHPGDGCCYAEWTGEDCPCGLPAA